VFIADSDAAQVMKEIRKVAFTKKCMWSSLISSELIVGKE